LKAKQAFLRWEAKKARANLRRARRYAKRTDRTTLNRAEQILVARLNSNELLDICKQKNTAYGHGFNITKPTTSHDASIHRMACIKMVNTAKFNKEAEQYDYTPGEERDRRQNLAEAMQETSTASSNRDRGDVHPACGVKCIPRSM
jgi:hypothetical protein